MFLDVPQGLGLVSWVIMTKQHVLKPGTGDSGAPEAALVLRLCKRVH